jgi:hypothetical protein
MSLSLLTTKSFWAGLASIATGIGLIIEGQVPEGIQLIIAGIITITLRDAIAKANPR